MSQTCVFNKILIVSVFIRIFIFFYIWFHQDIHCSVNLFICFPQLFSYKHSTYICFASRYSFLSAMVCIKICIILHIYFYSDVHCSLCMFSSKYFLFPKCVLSRNSPFPYLFSSKLFIVLIIYFHPNSCSLHIFFNKIFIIPYVCIQFKYS